MSIELLRDCRSNDVTLGVVSRNFDDGSLLVTPLQIQTTKHRFVLNNCFLGNDDLNKTEINQFQITQEQKEKLRNCTKMAFEIAGRITGKRSPLYLSGGTIRDILLDRVGTSSDYDFLGDFDLDQIQKSFSDFVVGRWDEVSTIKLKVGTSVFDFISTKDVKKTLSSWDITVSTMCFKDNEDFFDYFGGLESLNKKEIKIFDANVKIKEDPCRILRVFRFAEELGFGIEESTLKAVIDNSYLLQNIDYKYDLDKVLSLDYDKRVRILNNFYRYGIDQYLPYKRDNDPEIMEVIFFEDRINALAPIDKIVGLFPVQVYLVGGSIRDTILNKKVKDFDFKVHLNFNDIINILKINGYIETINLDLSESQYYVNYQAKSVSVVIDGVDVDISGIETTNISELIQNGDVNFSCCIFNANSRKIENPEIIKEIKRREIYFCDPESARADPLKIVNALKQISRIPEIIIPPQTEKIISEGIPSVVDYFRIHPEMLYKLSSICGHLNDEEVYSFFKKHIDGDDIFRRVERKRKKLQITNPIYVSQTVQQLSQQDRTEITALIKVSYGESCVDNKIFCENINSVVYKKENGVIVSCCLIDQERIYSAAAINGNEWSNIIRELVKSNYNVWLTADSSNQKILALCLISGLRVEMDPVVLKKILKSKYAKYNDSINIYYNDEGLLVFRKNNQKSYPQVLLRS